MLCEVSPLKLYIEYNQIHSKRSMTILSSSFHDNSARYSGGAIYSHPSGGGEEESIVDMSNSVLTNNAASEGGAVYIYKTGHLHDRASKYVANIALAGGKYIM